MSWRDIRVQYFNQNSLVAVEALRNLEFRDTIEYAKRRKSVGKFHLIIVDGYRRNEDNIPIGYTEMWEKQNRTWVEVVGWWQERPHGRDVMMLTTRDYLQDLQATAGQLKEAIECFMATDAEVVRDKQALAQIEVEIQNCEKAIFRGEEYMADGAQPQDQHADQDGNKYVATEKDVVSGEEYMEPDFTSEDSAATETIKEGAEAKKAGKSSRSATGRSPRSKPSNDSSPLEIPGMKTITHQDGTHTQVVGSEPPPLGYPVLPYRATQDDTRRVALALNIDDALYQNTVSAIRGLYNNAADPEQWMAIKRALIAAAGKKGRDFDVREHAYEVGAVKGLPPYLISLVVDNVLARAIDNDAAPKLNVMVAQELENLTDLPADMLTDKFNLTSPEGIAEIGDWRLNCERRIERYKQQFENRKRRVEGQAKFIDEVLMPRIRAWAESQGKTFLDFDTCRLQSTTRKECMEMHDNARFEEWLLGLHKQDPNKAIAVANLLKVKVQEKVDLTYHKSGTSAAFDSLDSEIGIEFEAATIKKTDIPGFRKKEAHTSWKFQEPRK